MPTVSGFRRRPCSRRPGRFDVEPSAATATRKRSSPVARRDLPGQRPQVHRSTREHAIGIDEGTTGVRAVVVREVLVGVTMAVATLAFRMQRFDVTYWGKLAAVFEAKMTPEDAIDVQLAKIGLKPDDIKYVVVSHMHLDHGGNVAKFPNSTLIIQDDELSFAMFPDEPFAGGYIPGDAQVLRAPVGSSKPSLMNMIRLEGDYDIFGDGSIVVHGVTPRAAKCC